MVGEVFVPSFGALGIGGVVAFVAGSLMLFDSDLEHFRLSLPLVAALALASVAFVMLVAGLALRQRRHRVVSGVEWMIGQLADAAEGFSREGSVELLGERWNARSPRPVARGQKVRITRVDGLTLEVEPETED
jgi:membrane-bound serine protease (ClpP class)